MSATDELRRLLDERGVEWMPIAWNPKKETFYHTSNGVGFCADEYTDGVRIYTDATITPAQAIDATLGRGTCKLDFTAFTKDGVDFAGFRCDGCGFTQAVPSGDLAGVTRYWSYCPNCGREVVNDQ